MRNSSLWLVLVVMVGLIFGWFVWAPGWEHLGEMAARGIERSQ